MYIFRWIFISLVHIKLVMNNKILGSILIAIAIVFLISLVIFKLQIDNLTENLMLESGGSCIKNGKCLHERSNFPVYIGSIIIFITFALGFYLIFFEKSKEKIENIQMEIVKTLKETKKKQNEDFEFLLKALDDDEKKVMRAVREQDGIEQATLRIRTDLSKTKLSVVLSELEKKNLIKKVPEGKKNRIYLKLDFIRSQA